MDAETSPVSRAGAARTATLPEIPAPRPKPAPCDTCAADAYLQWHEAQLTPSFNVEIEFTTPPGQRLVIEFVTATIEVPAGESARLRMFTGFSNGQAGNFDLALTPQGIRGGPVHLGLHPSGARHTPTVSWPSTSTETMPPPRGQP